MEVGKGPFHVGQLCLFSIRCDITTCKVVDSVGGGLEVL